MSTMETPPPDASTPVVGPPDRRCPRCGSTLAPEQEWCLACGAAAGTEVVEARGWRVPIYLGGGLVALGILGVILAIAALSNREEPAPQGSPGPGASVAPPVASPTISPIPPTPAPTITEVPTDPGLTPTPTPTPTIDPTVTPDPTETPTPDPGDPSSTTFGGWTGSDGDYTIIIESATNLSRAERVARQAENRGLTVGILDSDSYSSLNGGYQVVFTGTFATKSEAQDELSSVRSDYSDAYVKRIST